MNDVGGAPASASAAINVPAALAEKAREFTGREWLLDRIIAWADHSSARFLMVTGNPGTGKSALAAWLVGAGPASPEPRVHAEIRTRAPLVARRSFLPGRRLP